MPAAHPVAARSRAVRPAKGVGDGWSRLSALVALVLPFVLATAIALHSTLTLGMAASLALAPVWLRDAHARRGSIVLGLAVALCLLTAPILAQWTSLTHRVDSPSFTAAILNLVGVAGGVGALMWCRRWWSDGIISAIFGVGLLAQTVIQPTERLGENPWKFGYAMPLTVIALGLCGLTRRLWPSLLAIAALAGISGLNDGRSSSALLLMTAVLVAWQHRPHFKGRVSSTVGALTFLGLLAFTIYRALQAAILDGYLGSAAQERTQAQIEQSGSLILGGRPESGAAWALFHDRPLGFGPGIVPNLDDIMTAKSGMASLGYDPDNGYVEHYMLGQGRFELHSVGSDFWATYGPAGLVLALLIAALMLRYIGHSLAFRSGRALGLFLAVRVLWDLCFSPVPSSLDHLMLAVALVLLPRAVRGDASGEAIGAHWSPSSRRRARTQSGGASRRRSPHHRAAQLRHRE